ncbi:hypothetical protein ACFCXW_18610, partial [Streptomyces microflavus]
MSGAGPPDVPEPPVEGRAASLKVMRPSATWDTANPYLAGGLGLNIRVDYIHTGLPAADGTGRVRS